MGSQRQLGSALEIGGRGEESNIISNRHEITFLAVD